MAIEARGQLGEGCVHRTVRVVYDKIPLRTISIVNSRPKRPDNYPSASSVFILHSLSQPAVR
jgi:hypothetical protein